MPIVYESQSGKLKTGDLKIEQSTGMLYLKSSKALPDLTNEELNIWIARSSGDDTYLATRCPLKEAILLSLKNDDNLVQYYKGAYLYFLNIGVEGALNIEEGERLMISIDNLKSTDTWEIGYHEDYERTNSYAVFEHKTLIAGNTDVRVPLAGVSVVAFTVNGETEIGMSVDGQEKRMSFEELQMQMFEDENYLGFNSDGSPMPLLDTHIVIPSNIVDSLRFYKTSATIVDITFLKAGILPTSKAGMALKNVLGKKSILK